MRVTLLSFGSRGDVQPYVALGLGLAKSGYEVCLATHEEFRGFVEGHGLSFAAAGGDPRAILASEQGQSWLASGSNPVRFMRRLLRAIEPVIRNATADALRVCAGSDLIVDSSMGVMAAQPVAEKLGIPLVHAFVQPLTPTRSAPSIWFPELPDWLAAASGPYNLATHFLALQGLSALLRSSLGRTRRELLGLSSPGKSFWSLLRGPGRVLYGYSPAIVAPPADYREDVQVTGYWFLDASRDWQPPSELVEFLAAGPAPLFVGFGSMMDRDPQALSTLIIEALALAGQRGVLSSGWGGLGQDDVSEHVFVLDSAPHDWLFPRMAAVVHHGGAGTTAEGLRAGVPSIVVPFFDDQPFWGERVRRLGVGPAPISRKSLSVERLAQAMRVAVGDHAMRRRAAELGRRIASEDGVARAVAAIDALLSGSRG